MFQDLKKTVKVGTLSLHIPQLKKKTCSEWLRAYDKVIKQAGLSRATLDINS